MLFFGMISDFFMNLFYAKNSTQKGYAPLLDGFAALYTKRIYGRFSDCWNRPISSMACGRVDVMEREGHAFVDALKFTGKTQRCINLGSYNYLGFSENTGDAMEKNIQALSHYGPACTSTRNLAGTTDLHRELEMTVARFFHKEDAIITGMGYATNTTTIPSWIGKGGLIISDSLNHASLVVGCRLSGSTVRVFRHNDVKELEQKLQEAIIYGQPGTHLPWTKIIIMVEGLYSMEGDVCKLPEIIALKKKYSAYLYVDEAHSIGSLGKSGRGVCEYWGIDHAEVDILMGTFTKSFAAVGGYLASSKKIIDSVRATCYSSFYDTSMTPVCCQQILSAFRLIMGEDGKTEGRDKIAALRRNSIEVRSRLKEKGFICLGDYDSPVIPILIYWPSRLISFSRMCLKNGVAVVVVGAPATSMFSCRARLCMTAAHTSEDIDEALKLMEQAGSICFIRYNQASSFFSWPSSWSKRLLPSFKPSVAISPHHLKALDKSEVNLPKQFVTTIN
jgi:serine palmitoyltransferase